MKNRKTIKVLLVILCFVCAGVIFSCAMGRKKTTLNETSTEVLEKESQDESKEDQTPDETVKQVCVHICGSVVSPGVYYLNEGARVHEAVEMAGGLGEGAAPETVNLAEQVKDGEQIYIPSKQDLEDGVVSRITAYSDGLVDINTASLDELKELPGIGDIKAEAIISYRDEMGGFTSVEEVMNVAGIKDSSYDRIKDLIKV